MSHFSGGDADQFSSPDIDLKGGVWSSPAEYQTAPVCEVKRSTGHVSSTNSLLDSGANYHVSNQKSRFSKLDLHRKVRLKF